MTLLEYMLSMSCMALLMAVFAGGMMQLYWWRSSMLVTVHALTTQWIAAIKIARTIRRAPCSMRSWQFVAHRIMWHDTQLHEWYCKGNKLLFREGKGVASVASPITTLVSRYDVVGNGVRGIYVQLTGGSATDGLLVYIPLHEWVFACT